MTASNSKIKEGTISQGGLSGSSSTYQLQDIVGVNGGTQMNGSAYSLNGGFFNLNNSPVATVSNYNDSRPIDDETPTLQWSYSDVDNDTQNKYQLQVAQTSFTSPVVDTGIITSAAASYTTTILPRTEERTAYKWRVRVNDGFGWSAWAQANNGFILTSGEFLITGLSALTAPGGNQIDQDTWQLDNDPYFFWDSPSEGIEVLGYSYSLDSLPDDQIDSESPFVLFSSDTIGDGAHIFYVKAQRSSGTWGDAAVFDIWVDTTAPAVNNLTPSLGKVVGIDLPEVKARISDAASGVDPNKIELVVNQASIVPDYDSQTGEISYIPSIPFSDGQITVSLTAYDAVGNYGLPLTWSFIVDTLGPLGGLLINNGDEMTTTNIVTLNVDAEDETTQILEMMLSNDGVFDTESWEPYISLRKNWLLPAINGLRKVYARVKDEAGNISEIFFDEISLVILAPDTYILSGPSGITQAEDAQFTYRGSLDQCQFSYKFDEQDWSDWSTALSIDEAGLSEGNHYFMVRSAKDLNSDGLLQLDEIDPTPASRVWTVSFTGALKPSSEPEKPIKLWEEE
ncbi:MAG: hypothetical protein JW714_03030 [Candidatus Omnitrophica bacterium]|nr:hypothetical protein [Candidatus Omnitrophota bacterium]